MDNALTAAVSAVSRSPYGERGLKCNATRFAGMHGESLSLRRAWIEIRPLVYESAIFSVALLTESVD